VELYHYSTCGPSWPVTECNLPLPLPFTLSHEGAKKQTDMPDSPVEIYRRFGYTTSIVEEQRSTEWLVIFYQLASSKKNHARR